MRKYLYIIIPSSVLLVLAFFCSFRLFCLPVNYKDKNKVRFEVTSGMRTKTVSYALKEQGLIKSPKAFIICSRIGLFNFIYGGRQKLNLKTGVYRLSPSMSYKELYKILSSGHQDYIVTKIPEGLTINKIAEHLANEGICSVSSFKDASKNTDIISEFNISSTSLEGYLFPDTYYFTPGMKGEDCARLMVNNFFNKIKEIPGMSELDTKELNRIVKIASIVEREYRLKEEAPVISSVFHNRLKIGMGLYSCATVEYVITEIMGRPHPKIITYDDIAINNPYNTYKNAGLPPTAISNPGLVALNAACNPLKTEYLYFRIIDSKLGRHVFTKDLDQHINKGYVSNTKS